MINDIKESVKVVDLGKIFKSPVDITDPCYRKDSDARINGVKIKPGKYLCLAKTLDWNDSYNSLGGKRVDYHEHRVGAIGIFHVDVFPELASSASAGTLAMYPTDGGASELIGSIGVDAGLAGIFHNKPDYTDEQWSAFCSAIADGEVWEREESFYSLSGIGDGEYDVYGIPCPGEEDVFSALEIRFIDPDQFFTDEDEGEKPKEKVDWFNVFAQRMCDRADGTVWSDGEDILCKTEDAADAIYDLLIQLYESQDERVVIQTGYFDPEEDRRNGEENRYTGWWYVTID